MFLLISFFDMMYLELQLNVVSRLNVKPCIFQRSMHKWPHNILHNKVDSVAYTSMRDFKCVNMCTDFIFIEALPFLWNATYIVDAHTPTHITTRMHLHSAYRRLVSWSLETECAHVNPSNSCHCYCPPEAAALPNPPADTIAFKVPWSHWGCLVDARSLLPTLPRL